MKLIMSSTILIVTVFAAIRNLVLRIFPILHYLMLISRMFMIKVRRLSPLNYVDDTSEQEYEACSEHLYPNHWCMLRQGADYTCKSNRTSKSTKSEYF